MAVSGLDVISRALRLITVIGPADAVEASEAQDALGSLNAMIDGWQLQPLTMFHEGRAVYPLSSGTASYTIGTGGVFNQVRPVAIKRAGLIINTASVPLVEIPIEVFTPQEYDAIPIKALANPLIQGIYYDRNALAGLGLIQPYPIPNVASTSLVIYALTPVASFADLSTLYILAQGYEDAFVYNLARRLAPEYGKAVSDEVKTEARRTLADVKRSNIVPEEALLGPGVPGTQDSGFFDYRTGTIR
jgi:hypothetical protein